jgi:hypothetical protein
VIEAVGGGGGYPSFRNPTLSVRSMAYLGVQRQEDRVEQLALLRVIRATAAVVVGG